jgi:F0F1-type ATP synthase assembly protein I
MIKNSVRMLLLGLFLVTHASVLAVMYKKEVTEKVDKNQLQGMSDKSESNIKNQTTQKSASKSRQRMSAGKIAGIVVAVLLGVVTVGALVWFGISLFLLFCGL